MPTPHHPPSAALKALRTLGGDIRDARLRRRLTMSLLADRAFTSRATLARVERGEHSVGIGIYAAVLHALGLGSRLSEVADPRHDEIGQRLEAAGLPKRARTRRS